MEENISIIKKMLISEFKISGWDIILNPFIESEAFDTLTEKLNLLVEQDRRFTPKFKEVFIPFIETKFEDLKIVIVNQDPYPQFGVADGLAFSCSNDKKPEPSLKYMFEELYGENKVVNTAEYGEVIIAPKNNLKRWANQGVLLINTSFTCEINKIGSHRDIWKPFIEYVFECINKTNKDIIFVLMGRKAEYWQLRLPGQKIFKCPHPASAAYNGGVWKADDIFEKLNEELERQVKTCIIW
jgi:uracil-DNA glycosylase